MSIAQSRGNVVSDLDGVVYRGGDPIPGAGDALRAIEAIGFRIVFATNAATRTAATVAEAITRLTGFPARETQVVTSAMAVASMIRPEDHPVLASGEQGLVDTLADAGISMTADPQAARCVVVGLDRGFTYDRLHAASAAVRRGARFIASNTDATFPTPDGIAPGAGSLVAAVERASGCEAEPAGKPHEPMLAAIEPLLGPGATWVVGDRAETDLALGAAAGWHRVLVLTGVTPEASVVPDRYRPDYVLDGLTDLPGLLAAQSP